jgi:hypothetical protein
MWQVPSPLSFSIDDLRYFAQRATEEDVAAKNATCAAARERHEEMADMYRLRGPILKPDQPDRRRRNAEAADVPSLGEKSPLVD